MNLYPLIRPLFFQLEPERAHGLSMKMLKGLHRSGLSRLIAAPMVVNPRNVMGLEFPNPVGLAAGLDKNGEYIDALAALGFGFIEIGTVTPRPQLGNPKPRLFRLPDAQALINRMGFNNRGVDYLVAQVKRSRYRGILGINIGKNADTPMTEAVADYLIGLRKVYPYASYVTINISSPNTRNLRQLQQASAMQELLAQLKTEQRSLASRHSKYVPLVIKIAPDLQTEEIEEIAQLLVRYELDGVIATNTTTSREGIGDHPLAREEGGLSGVPLMERSTMVLKKLSQALAGKIPIIAAGGISNYDDAQKKYNAGASLIQIYSGFIFQGPALIAAISSP